MVKRDMADSELSQLLDLAIERGVKHSTLSSAIEDAILQEYSARYPRGLQPTSVLIDERRGTIHLLSESTDVTPKEFVVDAARIARMTILTLLQTAPAANKPTITVPIAFSLSSLLGWIPKLIFWGYNGLYVFALVMFLIGVLTNGSYRQSVWETASVLGVYKTVLIILAGTVPLATMVTVARMLRAQKASKLAALFFGFEIPAVCGLLLLASVSWAPQRVMWLILIIFCMGAATILASILEFRPPRLRHRLALFSCQTWTLLSSFYAIALYAFFLPLFAGYFFRDMFGGLFFSGRDIWYGIGSFSLETLIFLPLYLVFYLFWFVLFAVLLLLPFVVIGVVGTIFWRARTTLVRQIGTSLTNRITAGAGLILFFLTLAVSYQPSISPHLKKLAALQEAVSFEDREDIARTLIPQERTIKQALLDMYDARARYLWTKEDDFLSRAYQAAWDVSKETGQFIQDTFVILAYPFVYHGPIDQGEAAKHFDYLFGRPITEEKRVFPTPSPAVHVVAQRIQAATDPESQAATVTIEEEYETDSYRAQEVIYEFSLPNDAVITELRLGANLEYPGIFAPKGAAQRTYQQEVNRSRDPALLEQTGPRQYRLRVFPIPAANDRTTLNGRHQKVSFAYVVMKEPEGFALPRISLRQNVFMDEKTQRQITVDGVDQRQDPNDPFISDNSSPGSLCKQPAPLEWQTGNTPSTFSASFYPMSAEEAGSLSVCAPANNRDTIPALNNARIAILFDASATNKTHPFPEDLRAVVQANPQLLSANKIDWYRFNDRLSQPLPLTDDLLQNVLEVTHFGKSDLAAALSALPDHYDAIIVATGELRQPNETLPTRFRQTPLYLLHADGKIPAYPAAWTHTLVRSGGGVVDSLPEVFVHIAYKQRQERAFIPWSGQVALALPGSVWKMMVTGSNIAFLPIEQTSFTIPSKPLSYLLSKAYFFDQWGKTPRFAEMDLSTRDAFHQFAVRNRLITPYTSLLSLVNQQQYQTLQREAQNYERYDEAQTSQPIFTPRLQSGGGILSPWLGFDVTNLELPDAGSPALRSGAGSDLNVGITAQKSVGISSLGALGGNMLGGGGSTGGILVWLFILGNILLLGGGGFIYLVLLMKRRFSRPKHIHTGSS